MCLLWENVQTFYENEMANKTPLVYGIFRLMLFYKLITYIVDVGSDNWILLDLIEQCHFNYAMIQFCFIWILPGFFSFVIVTWMNYKEKKGFGIAFSKGFFGFIFYVPLTIWFHIDDMIKLTDKSLDVLQG